jgi:glycerol-3-phosphate dehydrogenase
MNRPEMLRRIGGRKKAWDFVVIGGGATGMGIALDAAARGYDVLLLERSDFGKGTSSRSTKLVHGGVRYLQQGNVSLVMEALQERGYLLRNAPHLVSNLPFIVPAYEWWEATYYTTGLKLYALLAGKHSLGPSKLITRSETISRLPRIQARGLRGGVVYHDGQFDDTRLLISLARTAVNQGAIVVNYTEAIGLRRDGAAKISGVDALDAESGEEFHVETRIVINATGPFCDSVRKLSDPGAPPMIRPSQGIHLVVDGSFLPGANAMMIPRTRDGRVMFAIPWLGYALLGTTDTPVNSVDEEPKPFEEEVEFVLETAARFFDPAPQRQDVKSVFAGIRPLLRGNSSRTATLSRDHEIQVDESGLVTITGGKWTTYRRMAERCVDQVAGLAGLPKRDCTTRSLPLHDSNMGAPGVRLHGSFSYTREDVIRAVRDEMARTLEDVLARRLRVLFLDAQAALEMAPGVASLIAPELGWDEGRIEAELVRFRQLASVYSLAGNPSHHA